MSKSPIDTKYQFDYDCLTMGKKSKDKGKRGEREAAKKLSSILNISLSRGVQYKGSTDSPDIAGLKEFGLHPEIKRDESTISAMMYKGLAQASSDAGSDLTPFIMSRRNGRGWVVAVDLENLIPFCEGILKAHNYNEKDI